MDNLDPPAAFRFGIITTGQRVLVFFLALCLGTIIGGIFGSIQEGVHEFEGARNRFVEDVVQGNNLQSFDILGMIGTVFRHAAEEIVYSPLSMFGYVLFGFAKSKLCVLIMPVLGVSFLIILYSETEYWRGIALLLVFVPMNILWIKDGSLIAWSFVACYLGALFYCYRRICKIRELEW